MIKRLHLLLIVLSIVIVGCSQSPNTEQKPEQDKKESEQVEKYTEEEMKNIAFVRSEIVKRCEKFFGTPEGSDYKVGDCIWKSSQMSDSTYYQWIVLNQKRSVDRITNGMKERAKEGSEELEKFLRNLPR